jgi:hypothetical protein
MKKALLCLFLLSSFAFANDFESQGIDKLPKGTIISFNKFFLVEANTATVDFGYQCKLKVEAAAQDRQFTTLHTLVLTKATLNTYQAYVEPSEGCEYGQTQTCVDVLKTVADYNLEFAVYKNGEATASKPVVLNCKDESGAVAYNTAYLRSQLKNLGATLTIKSDAIDF